MGRVTGNAILDCALLAWLVAQVVKVLLEWILNRSFQWKRFVSSGGMPSSHSAFVVACTTAIGRLYGISGPLFALSVVVSAVVMYDACNVRRSAGDTARLVNQLLTAENFADDLKIIMGHTPFQVAVGAALGLAVGFLA